MKKIMGLVVIIAALVLGGYYGMGLVTERTLKKNVGIINHTNGVFIDIQGYDRGWFTSTAALVWHLHVPEHIEKSQDGQTSTVPAKEFSLQMPLKVYHGPFIFSENHVHFGLGYARSNIALPQEFTQKFSNLFTEQSDKPELDVSLFVNYLNNSRLHVDLPSFKLTTKQGGDQFEWLGMDSDVSVSSNLRKIDGNFSIDGFSMTKDKVKATLGKVSSAYNLHESDTGLYLGEASLSVPSFVVTENSTRKLLEVNQFSIRTGSGVENDLFSSYFKASLDKLVAQDKSYGPAHLELSIKNLDAQVLAEINQQTSKIQQGTDTERQQALLAILPNLPRLFGKGAEFEVSKLSFVVPEGEINGDLLVSLPAGNTGNPFQLLQKVQGHGKLKVPVSVVRSLVMASVKQNLQNQPNVQQVMMKQINNNVADQKAQTSTAPSDSPASSVKTGATAAAPPATPPQTTDPVQGKPTQDSSAQGNPLTAVELEKEATTQTSQKLSALEQSGLLSLQGKEYVIELSLLQGQLSVNGKPFNQSMIQF